MKILIVKLSSLGDVLHTLPVVHDITTALPSAQIDWVVERAFAGVVRRCQGVNKVITCEFRTWRKSPFSSNTKNAWRAFTSDLQNDDYDAVIDLQGLTKSAAVSWLAKLTLTGRRFAMANRTDGSSYEAPTRWVADVAIRLQPRIHAVQRARDMCAKALGYKIDQLKQKNNIFKPVASAFIDSLDINNIAINLDGKVVNTIENSIKNSIIFAHGSSREDKLWPVENWIELGRRLHAQGLGVALAHGSDDEEQRSKSMADQIPNSQILPRLDLDALLNVLGSSAGVVGVDSGLSHMAVALDLPHVQIYNFDTAWRTGPVALNDSAPKAKQLSVYAQPTPTVDAVWQVWLAVRHQARAS